MIEQNSITYICFAVMFIVYIANLLNVQEIGKE